FTRAPGGAVMIDDFRPFMTTAKVTRIQGYFLTIGGGEAQLRREIRPKAPGPMPAVETLNRQWPAISADMAPMIGAMSDNVDNSAGANRSGMLQLAAGSCTASPPTGSWFRMVQPGGTPDKGPYVDNGDSPCPDKAVTPLSPGTDGGLRVGDYQPQPNPPFAQDG